MIRQSNENAIVIGAGITGLAAAAACVWWDISSVPDFVHPKTRGEPPADLEKRLRFNHALFRLAASDAAVHRLLYLVIALVEPPDALRDPDLVRRVEAEMATA